MKVTIERDLSTATCGDIAITAAEGGIGYWSVIDEYKSNRWCPTDGWGECTEVPEDFVFYTITEIDEITDIDDGECGDMVSYEITPALIRRGIQLFLTGAGDFRGRPFDDMEDWSCMDSDEADCVIQLGCFGEVVYG
jgi:hypothetical protein